MLHRIVITKRAYAQFQSICEYLVDEFGECIADNFELEVEQCVATLMNFPESGHPEPIESKYTYRSKIVGNCNRGTVLLLYKNYIFIRTINEGVYYNRYNDSDYYQWWIKNLIHIFVLFYF